MIRRPRWYAWAVDALLAGIAVWLWVAGDQAGAALVAGFAGVCTGLDVGFAAAAWHMDAQDRLVLSQETEILKLGQYAAGLERANRSLAHEVTAWRNGRRPR